MNPSILGVIGPGFLNQVHTLPKTKTLILHAQPETPIPIRPVTQNPKPNANLMDNSNRLISQGSYKVPFVGVGSP